jgi:hypothetical protein
VPRPSSRKIVGSRWVFRTKRNPDNSIARYKARLVAQGFSQKPGIDYQPDEISAPVASIESIRTTLARATQQDWTILQLDVDTAYLNAPVSEEIFMKQPPGFEKTAADGTELVCKLNRSLYGLKQAAFNWNKTITSYFTEIGLKPCSTDPCVFSKHHQGDIAVIVLYVDDLLITGNRDSTLQDIKQQLSRRFKMKDLGEVSQLLGMQVTRDRSAGTLKIDQTKYIQDMLDRFGLTECNAARIPADPGQILSKSDNAQTEAEKAGMSNKPYRSLVGSLMYAAWVTRPDVANAVRVLSRYMQEPGERHWLAAKRCLRYLAGSKSIGITYRQSEPEDQRLEGYSDANWAGDLDNARSTTGVAFTLAGGVISYSSKLQATVARSSMESEYMALFEAAQTAEALRNLLQHLGAQQTDPTPIHVDNTACQLIANPNSYTKRSRHIHVRYHFTREAIEQNIITLIRVSSENQLADGLTKNLPAPRFNTLRSILQEARRI